MRLIRPVLLLLLVTTGGLLAAQSSPPAQPADAPAAAATTGAQAAAPLQVSPTALAGWTVVLDPGHGGDDAGVRAGDATEAQLTLDVARRATTALTAHGARVVLTREVDIAVDADTRATRANQAHAHVVVSLHFNRSPRAGSSGLEIYTHAPAAPDGGVSPGQARTLPLVRWDRVQDRHVPGAEHLADLLGAAFAGRVPVSATLHRRLPLRPLAGIDAPAVLLELAYLSNPEQAAQAVTPEFHAAVADALVEALSAARRQPEAVR